MSVGNIKAKPAKKQSNTQQNEPRDCWPEIHHLFPKQFSTAKRLDPTKEFKDAGGIRDGDYRVDYKGLPNTDFDVEEVYNKVELHVCTHRLLTCRGKGAGLPHDDGWKEDKKGKDWPNCSPGVHTNSRIPKIIAIAIAEKDNEKPQIPSTNEIKKSARKNQQHNWNKDWKDYLLRIGLTPFPVMIVFEITEMCDTYQIPRK